MAWQTGTALEAAERTGSALEAAECRLCLAGARGLGELGGVLAEAGVAVGLAGALLLAELGELGCARLGRLRGRRGAVARWDEDVGVRDALRPRIGRNDGLQAPISTR